IEFRKECWFDPGQGHQTAPNISAATLGGRRNRGFRGGAETNRPCSNDAATIIRSIVTSSGRYLSASTSASPWQTGGPRRILTEPPCSTIAPTAHLTA